MILTEFLAPKPDRLWKLAPQIGVTHAIVKCAPELSGRNPPWDIDALRSIQNQLAACGLTLHGLEGDQFDMTRIKLGLDGRDEDLELYCRMLRNMGELGITLLCYNFMAGRGWARSTPDAPIRGGARATRFRLADTPARTELGEIAAESIWENYQYFIHAILPAAEEAGVNLGLHPDDPPLPHLSGIGRIFHTPEGFDRALALSPSPRHGITFCLANFQLMNADLRACFRKWAPRIHFLHVRQIEGNAEDFTELFHDQGTANLPEFFQFVHDSGFRGPVRCDHVPSMEGESPAIAGYGTLGRLFAIGYFKGILDTHHIPHQ